MRLKTLSCKVSQSLYDVIKAQPEPSSALLRRLLQEYVESLTKTGIPPSIPTKAVSVMSNKHPERSLTEIHAKIDTLEDD